MARVRIEIWDNEDNVRAAEVEHPESRVAYERAARMAEATLPPEPEPTKLKPGSYSMVVNNVKFDEVNGGLLMGTSVPPNNFTVRVSGQRKPCGQTCRARDPEGDGEDEGCSDTCAKPEGHDGWHETADRACTWAALTPCKVLCARVDCWSNCGDLLGHSGDHACHLHEGGDRPPFSKKDGPCGLVCDFGNCWVTCVRPIGHEPDCYCTDPTHNLKGPNLVIILNRRRRGHTVAHHRNKPTSNVASGWRAAQKDAKKQVRVEETKRELARPPEEDADDDRN
jgi:hypothetical protein